MIGGDFHDRKNHEEKERGSGEGGRKRPENIFADFRRFISEMEMGDIKYRGKPFT